jgi:myo-inositol-1(or 4)-monophosphatase
LNELDVWRARALEIAQEAGTLLMEGWRCDPAVHQKSAIDLVTEFDLRSEARIRERMAEAFPHHDVVAEEGSAGDRRTGEWVWYVDPLDGTTNFAHGHFFFAVSIGLAHREAGSAGGRPVLGVVHAPALRTTWAGAEGRGATRDADPCRVSRTALLQRALVATGFPYDRAQSEEDNLRETAHIVPRLQGIRRCGSAAMDLCLVADGTYDGYWEQKLRPWDACAGLAIVRAAGGNTTDYEGLEATAESSRLVVTNGPLHPELLREVQAARRSFRSVSSE